VFDDRFAEARGVVIKVKTVGVFIVAEFVEAVRIGELAESAELRGVQAALQFVGDGHQCHVLHYSIRVVELSECVDWRDAF
jgi:hypothetical protein